MMFEMELNFQETKSMNKIWIERITNETETEIRVFEKKNALIKSEKIERGEKIDFFDIEIIQLEKNRLKFKAD